MVQCFQTYSSDVNDDEDDKRNISSNKNNRHRHQNNDNYDDKKAVESIIYKTGTCLMQCH